MNEPEKQNKFVDHIKGDEWRQIFDFGDQGQEQEESPSEQKPVQPKPQAGVKREQPKR